MLSAQREPVTITDIARELELEPSAVFRLLSTLETLGYVENLHNTKLYRTRGKLLNLGFQHVGARNLPEVARPYLEQLQGTCIGAATHLAVREEQAAIIIVSFPPAAGWLRTLPIGTRMPLYATMTGIALLTGMSDREIRALYDGATFEPLTENTPRTVNSLLRMVNRARDEGFAVGPSGRSDGIYALSVPVKRRDETVGAVNLTAIETSANKQAMNGEWLERAKQVAAEVSAEIRDTPDLYS